jgi:hypothetical protein
MVAPEQEREPGEVGAERFNVAGRAADKPFQRVAKLVVVSREPVQ